MSLSYVCGKLVTLWLLSAVHGQTLPYNLSVFDGQHFTSRQAYYRWRHWLLHHPAVVQKVPPVPNTNESDNSGGVNISVHMTPVTILGVDEAHQTVQLFARFQFFWTDPALALNKELIELFTDGNVSHLPFAVIVPSNVVWLPSVIVTERADNLPMIEGFSTTKVNREGVVHVNLPFAFTFSCPFDMTDYPFDEHICSVTVFDISKVADLFPLGVPWDKSSKSNFSISGEWDLMGVTHKTLFYLPGQKKPYPQFILHLRRKTTYYTVMIILPMMLTSYLNLLVFFLPPDLGDKASYLVTLNVSMSVFSSFFNTDMPRGLDSVPKVFILLLFIYAESLLVLLLSLLVLRKYKLQQMERESAEPCSFFKSPDGRVSQVDADAAQKAKKEGKITAAHLDCLFFGLTAIGNTIGLAYILAPVYRP